MPATQLQAWTRRDFADPRAWVKTLSPSDLGEIDDALAATSQFDKAPWTIRSQDFPLPELGRKLKAMRHELEYGSGFAVLGGFPVHSYTYEESVRAYCGIVSYIGHAVAQNCRNEHVVDVVDKGLPYSHNSRGYSSNKLLPFHTDGADIASLLCLDNALRGGESIIVSAPTVYDMIKHERPDCLRVLEHGFYHHRRGEQPPGESPLSATRIPVFSTHGGLLHCCYNRNPIDWSEKEGVQLSQEEKLALDVFDAVVARRELQLSMALRPGDIQFVNNFVILHSRTEYEDGPRNRRHLVRIWSEVPNARRRGPTLLNLYAPSAARYQLDSVTR